MIDMYKEALDFQKLNGGYPKRIIVQMGLSEWECSDGSVFYNSNSAVGYETYLIRQRSEPVITLSEPEWRK